MRVLSSATFLVILLFPVQFPCAAQEFAMGVKGGVRTTDDVQGDATPESKRYIVGPMVEFRLPLGLGVEVDALYHRFGYRTAAANLGGSFTGRERANSWEFPLLLKYRLPGLIVRPYVSGGYAPRIMSGSGDTDGFTIDLSTGNQTHIVTHHTTHYDTSHGVVLGGGLELGLGKLRFAPEVRYTHWNNQPVQVFGSQGYHVESTQDQVDVLLGITWH